MNQKYDGLYHFRFTIYNPHAIAYYAGDRLLAQISQLPCAESFLVQR